MFRRNFDSAVEGFTYCKTLGLLILIISSFNTKWSFNMGGIQWNLFHKTLPQVNFPIYELI